jgi:CspA family cold shock protein
MSESAVGTVKWYNGTKGYGFINIPGRDEDIFIHVTVLKKAGIADLLEGDQVEIEYEEGKKGFIATACRLTSVGSRNAQTGKILPAQPT